MNKTIKEMGVTAIEQAMFEVVDLDVKERLSPQGWCEINDYKFKSKNILITKILAQGNDFYLNYVDDTGPTVKVVLVPPDFMLKQIEPNAETKKLIEKFEIEQLKNLSGPCHFSGKVGSDPEIFCQDKEGRIIPAFAFLPSKEKPIRVPGYGNNYAVEHPTTDENGSNLYWDGFQAEFTTKEAACMGWHGDSIQAGLRGIYEALVKHDKKATLSTKTVIDLDEKDMIEAPSECLAFGCNPSLNAYGMNGMELPGELVNYRSAGGHIHLSFNQKYTPDQMKQMVKGMDAILGVAGVSMCAKYDDPRRRIMYGLAGEYRLPPHGLEYRVLSNAWLFHPVLANIVFDLGRTAAMFGQMGFLKFWKATEQETIQCINTCDVTLARKILKDNEELFKRLLDVKLGSSTCVEFSYRAIINGLETVIANPEDIVGNWGLTEKWKGHCDGLDKNVHYTVGNGGSGGVKKI